MKGTTISIIVPIYNVEPYVEACINSINRQTFEGSIECIIVDDCGTDESMTIVERIIANYEGPITYKIIHHNHNCGLSAARNTGMDSATGDYIFFLDSDDELTDDCIQKLSEPLKEKKYDIIVGKFENKDENGTYCHGILVLPEKTVLYGHDILYTYCKGNLYSMVWNKLYRISFLRSHRLSFKAGIIHEDELWTLQLACLSQSLYVVRQTTYKYRRRKNSIMTSSNTNSMINANAYYTYVIEMGKFVKEKQINEDAAIEIIRRRFYETLRLQVCHPSIFIKRYRTMRHHTISFLKFFRQNAACEKQRIRDYHFLIPSLISPYYEYGVETMLMASKYVIYGFNKVMFIIRNR